MVAYWQRAVNNLSLTDLIRPDCILGMDKGCQPFAVRSIIGSMTDAELAEVARTRSLIATGAAGSIRRAARLSLSDVADSLGVDVATVWRWEHNQRTPRAEVALRYGRLLDRLMGAAR